MRAQARRRGDRRRHRVAVLAVAAAAPILAIALLGGGDPTDAGSVGDAMTPRTQQERLAGQAFSSEAAKPTDAPPIAPATAIPQTAAPATAPASASGAPEAGAAAAGTVGTLPSCAHGDAPASIDVANPHLTVVDTTLAVPEHHGPAAVVAIGEAGLDGRGSIAAEAVPDLRALVEAARDAHLALIGVSGYRSHADQARMFAVWEAQSGRESALRSSARAGHSEHQLGYALDFSSRGVMDPWRLGDWATTPEGAWMAENAWRFGWVMSYPRDRDDVTCYRYEPWHYRWVGREVAAAVHESGLTLREFLWERERNAAGVEP